jgi:hypothetical protein
MALLKRDVVTEAGGVRTEATGQQPGIGQGPTQRDARYKAQL